MLEEKKHKSRWYLQVVVKGKADTTSKWNISAVHDSEIFQSSKKVEGKGQSKLQNNYAINFFFLCITREQME